VYKEHPVFEKPDDENIKIWRYLDFTKFVSLLDKKALFFPRADKLPDPFEGSYSKANIKLRPEIYKEISAHALSQIPNIFERFRKFVIINSWHMNEYESAAMWKLYLKTDEGVAIQSTFKQLTRSFDNYVERNVFIGKVKYIDYETDWLPEGNAFYPFLHKRKSFIHERELRAIIVRLPYRKKKSGEEATNIDFNLEPFDTGAYIPVDLETLIEKIYVSPTAAKWFSDLVKSIVSRYDLNKEVIQSSLAEGPVY